MQGVRKMIALCFCKMVSVTRNGHPATVPHVLALAPTVRMAWRCIGFQESATPFAVVIGDATAAQITTLNSRTDMFALDGRTFRTMLVSDLSAGVRTKISDVLTANGVTNAGITGTDTLIEAFRKILRTISPGAVEDMQNMLDEYRTNNGYDLEQAP
jgi:hypothetical protein